MAAVNLQKMANQTQRVDLSELSPETAAAAEAILAGAPAVLVTGGAGTGKTTFLHWLLRNMKKRMAVVAPTGIAALNAGGMTIHKFFRFKPNATVDDLARENDVARQLDVLIVDEVSMVRADLLDLMDAALRKWRRKPMVPFGGVQMVFVGDLLQLPPVVTEDEADAFYQLYPSPWFFSAKVMASSDVQPFLLTKIYRQTDEHFATILNRIRMNDDHREAVAELNRRCFRDVTSMAADLTLTATNAVAERINAVELAKLPASSERAYHAVVEGALATTEGRSKAARFPAPETLTLRVGAQVVVVRNTEDAVNGSLGVVTSLGADVIEIRLNDTGATSRIKQETWEQVRYSVAGASIVTETTGSFTQFPLVLGWAITIHRSQGLTLDSVLVDLGKGAFAPGQAYVALSRCRSIERLRLARPLSMRDVMADPAITDLYRRLAAA